MSTKDPYRLNDEEARRREEKKKRAAGANPDVPSPEEGEGTIDESPGG